MGAMNELIDAPAVESAAAILAESAPQVQWDHTAAAVHLLQDLNLRARTDLVAQALQDDIGSVPGAGYPTAAGSFRATLACPAARSHPAHPRFPLHDPSEYVRRSVANHLNDLARHAPSAVVATAREWLSAADASTGRVRHGLRTLVKKGHPGALALLAVDYLIHYRKANGSQSAKVFKASTLTLAPGEGRSLSKRHAFRQMTTRVHHPGLHALELQVNGAVHGHAEFVLVGA